MPELNLFLLLHRNPGAAFTGVKNRVAYLPHNEDGRQLLMRLEWAFVHGLSLTVGTSLTTGQANSVTWSSIPHKSSRTVGSHGFPDPNYFANCNKALDDLSVPAAKDL